MDDWLNWWMNGWTILVVVWMTRNIITSLTLRKEIVAGRMKLQTGYSFRSVF